MRIKTFSLYILLTQRFFNAYTLEAQRAYDYWISNGAQDLLLEGLLVRRLDPLFQSYFNQMFQASNTMVEQNIAVLSRALKVPFKYNRQVIEQINGISVFTGYYNRRYTSEFTRQEIDRLKRVILKGTYENMTESKLAAEIKKTINVSDRRCRLLARSETQRLRETTKAIYSQEPEVKAQYDRVWYTVGDGNVRPSHQAMNGKKARPNGLFYSDDVGEIAGPGSGPAGFSAACRCRTEFIKK